MYRLRHCGWFFLGWFVWGTGPGRVIDDVERMVEGSAAVAA